MNKFSKIHNHSEGPMEFPDFLDLFVGLSVSCRPRDELAKNLAITRWLVPWAIGRRLHVAPHSYPWDSPAENEAINENHQLR
jgi:hypothetical protein